MTKEDLLAELEDLLRTMPDRQQLRSNSSETLSWLGRATAVINTWNPAQTISARLHISSISGFMARETSRGIHGLLVLLHQARAELQMETVGPTNIADEGSKLFHYFDEIRKVIEEAQTDILFIDPYLDAEFVGRYLSHVKAEVTVRLLAREKLNTLLPAAQLFAEQNGTVLQIRSAPNFHDRYVFIDERACYQSGASFKDGAKKSPTTITQITDAFPAVLKTYQDMWQSAEVIL